MNLGNLFKSDWFHWLTDLLSYNRYAVIATLAAAVFVGLTSCEAFTTEKSPQSGKPLTREQLVDEASQRIKNEQFKLDNAKKSAAQQVAQITLELEKLSGQSALEVDSIRTTYQTTIDKLDARQEFIGKAFSWVNGLVGSASSTLGPAGSTIWAGAATLLAAGLGLDNRRKDKVIAGTAPQPPTGG